MVLTINDPDSLNNDAGVTSVAISPNGMLVAAGSLDTVVRIWDVTTGMLVERLRGHRDSVYSVAFTPDGKGLVSGSLDKTLKYWDVSGLVSNGVVKVRKEGSSGGINGPGVSNGRKDTDKGSQCKMDFTGHKVNHLIHLVTSEDFLMILFCAQDYVLSVAVSHDGHWVVSGSKDRGVQFWDSRTAIVQCMLQGHKNSGKLLAPHITLMDFKRFTLVISIDLSPAGNILATGSGDWQARICEYFFVSSCIEVFVDTSLQGATRPGNFRIESHLSSIIYDSYLRVSSILPLALPLSLFLLYSPSSSLASLTFLLLLPLILLLDLNVAKLAELYM